MQMLSAVLLLLLLASLAGADARLWPRSWLPRQTAPSAHLLRTCGFFSDTGLPEDALRIAVDINGPSFTVDFVGRDRHKMAQVTK